MPVSGSPWPPVEPKVWGVSPLISSFYLLIREPVFVKDASTGNLIPLIPRGNLQMHLRPNSYSGSPAVGTDGAGPSMPPPIVFLLSGWWKYVTWISGSELAAYEVMQS